MYIASIVSLLSPMYLFKINKGVLFGLSEWKVFYLIINRLVKPNTSKQVHSTVLRKIASGEILDNKFTRFKGTRILIVVQCYKLWANEVASILFVCINFNLHVAPTLAFT